MKLVGSTRVRRDLTAVLEELNQDSEPIYLTDRGNPRAVLVPCSMFEEMVERIEDLEDALAVIQAESEPRIPLEEYLRRYEAEQSEEVPALS